MVIGLLSGKLTFDFGDLGLIIELIAVLVLLTPSILRRINTMLTSIKPIVSVDTRIIIVLSVFIGSKHFLKGLRDIPFQVLRLLLVGGESFIFVLWSVTSSKLGLLKVTV